MDIPRTQVTKDTGVVSLKFQRVSESSGDLTEMKIPMIKSGNIVHKITEDADTLLCGPQFE